MIDMPEPKKTICWDLDDTLLAYAGATRFRGNYKNNRDFIRAVAHGETALIR